ncbi:MAG: roadblock/LC7 domain-containing protein [Gammaproteobacteria bacterium]
MEPIADNALSNPLYEPPLNTLLSENAMVRGVLLATRDGLVMAHQLVAEAKPRLLAAVASSLLGLSESVCLEQDLITGLRSTFVEGEDGAMLVLPAGDELVLLVLTEPHPDSTALKAACEQCVQALISLKP